MERPPLAAGKRPAWHWMASGVAALGLVVGVGVVIRSVSDNSDDSDGQIASDDDGSERAGNSVAPPPGYTETQVKAFVADVDEIRPGLTRRDHEILVGVAAGMCDTLRRTAANNSEIVDDASTGPPAEVANRFMFPYLLGIMFDERPDIAPLWMSRGADRLCPDYAADVYTFLVGRGVTVPT